jgi:hypothetical protein
MPSFPLLLLLLLLLRRVLGLLSLGITHPDSTEQHIDKDKVSYVDVINSPVFGNPQNFDRDFFGMSTAAFENYFAGRLSVSVSNV